MLSARPKGMRIPRLSSPGMARTVNSGAPRAVPALITAYI